MTLDQLEVDLAGCFEAGQVLLMRTPLLLELVHTWPHTTPEPASIDADPQSGPVIITTVTLALALALPPK